MPNEIDIRKNRTVTPNRIRVFDASLSGEETLDVIFKEDSDNVYVLDSKGGDEYSLRVSSKEHALDIIKGIEKAIELGWFK